MHQINYEQLVTFTEYPLPMPESGPYGITAGKDGALWFTENQGNKIGRITTSGEITEYPLPVENAGALVITAGPDLTIWFVTLEEQKDLDKLGIAKNAREEKIRARNEKMKQDAAYNARMAQLYREVILKEKSPVSHDGFISLDALAKPADNGHNENGNGRQPKPEIEVGEAVAGD